MLYFFSDVLIIRYEHRAHGCVFTYQLQVLLNFPLFSLSQNAHTNPVGQRSLQKPTYRVHQLGIFESIVVVLWVGSLT